MADIGELRGHVLQCCCFPWPCHGDILAEMVNGDIENLADQIRLENVPMNWLSLNDEFQSREALNPDAIEDYVRIYQEMPEIMLPIEAFVLSGELCVVDGFYRV